MNVSSSVVEVGSGEPIAKSGYRPHHILKRSETQSLILCVLNHACDCHIENRTILQSVVGKADAPRIVRGATTEVSPVTPARLFEVPITALVNTTPLPAL